MDAKKRTIGFIGAGRVGVTLGKYLAQNGCQVTGYASCEADETTQAAEFTSSKVFSSIEKLVAGCDIIFLTVPDDSIESVWLSIRELDIAGKWFCHCSGALSSQVLEGAEERRAAAISLHPMAAINSRWDSFRQMHRISFTIEGSPTAAAAMKELFCAIGNPVEIIPIHGKALYHTGAVFLTNFVAALVQMGTGLMEDGGLDKQFVERAYQELFLDNARSICERGLPDALTGPVERGDADTIRRHLDCLTEPSETLYRLLSMELVRLAGRKNPHKDYSNIEKVLEE